jgi:hypothetical protein
MDIFVAVLRLTKHPYVASARTMALLSLFERLFELSLRGSSGGDCIEQSQRTLTNGFQVMRKRANFKLTSCFSFYPWMSGSFLRFSCTTYLTLGVRGVLTSRPAPIRATNCEATFVILRHTHRARFYASLRLTLPVFG